MVIVLRKSRRELSQKRAIVTVRRVSRVVDRSIESLESSPRLQMVSKRSPSHPLPTFKVRYSLGFAKRIKRLSANLLGIKCSAS